MSDLMELLLIEAAAKQMVDALDAQHHDLMVAIERASERLQAATRAVERDISHKRELAALQVNNAG